MSLLGDLFDKGVHQGEPQRDISIPMSQYTEAGLKAAFAAASVLGEPELADVPVRMLRATQAKVNVREGVSDEPIDGIRDPAGLVHIVDGHHRADAAKRGGDATIRARLFDLDLGKAARPGGKFDKATVDYSRGKPHAHCGLCVHYEPPACELVEGEVEPQMWCELFQPEVAKAVSDRFNFDRFDQATQDWLREQQDELIAELEQDARDTIDMVISSGVREGLSADEMADQIRDVISLTETQAQAVLNYRDMVENLDSDALSRQLRSGAYDDALAAAIESDTPLDDAMIDEMVSAYEDNYLDYRADTIAGTESTRMANAGLQDSYEQAIARGALPSDAVRQFWLVDLDERTCDICAPIPDYNPDGVEMGDSFDSDDGPQDQPPVHPNCRCSIEIVTDLDQVPDEESA